MKQALIILAEIIILTLYSSGFLSWLTQAQEKSTNGSYLHLWEYQ